VPPLRGGVQPVPHPRGVGGPLRRGGPQDHSRPDGDLLLQGGEEGQEAGREGERRLVRGGEGRGGKDGGGAGERCTSPTAAGRS
jgi:hypothetical protein